MAHYPVMVGVPDDPGQNRLWGIPILGWIVRAIVLIPQAIVLALLGLVVYVSFLVNWIPILLNGRPASWMVQLYGGYLRMTARCSLYLLMVTGTYPPFWITGDHPIGVEVSANQAVNRWWGIPIVGVFVRWLILLPHLIVIGFLGIAAWFVSLVAWAPILINGRQADVIVRFFGGIYRWTTRAAAYGLFLTDRYPPFSLDGDPSAVSSPDPAAARV